jgi:lysophospholipase L1-like esterase
MTTTVLALAVVALGVVAWTTVRSGSGSNTPPARGTTTTVVVGSTTDPISGIVAGYPPRSLSHDDPLRLWVGGDSLAGEVGPSLGEQLADSGIVSTRVDFKVGSGLHDDGLRDWPARAAQQMQQVDPDVAVFVIGANDASIVDRSGNWKARYRAKVAEMMDTLGDSGRRTVYWVGPPPLRNPSLERGTQELGTLMADEAKAHDNVVYVDAYTMFADADGHYTRRIDMPDLGLTDVLVRISDGVHFTNDGADWLAYRIARLLDEQWQITRQSGGKRIGVTIEQGGGVIPGYRPRPPRTTHSTTTTQASTSSTTGESTTSIAPPTSEAPTTTSEPTATTATPTTSGTTVTTAAGG